MSAASALLVPIAAVVAVVAAEEAALAAEAAVLVAVAWAEADSNKPRYNTLKTSYNKEMRQERVFLPHFLYHVFYYAYNTKER